MIQRTRTPEEETKMSHEITNNDSFGYVGEKAWHGLGVELPDGLGAVDAFERLGLDWKTDLLPVYAERLTADGVERVEASGHRLHVRSDTGNVLGMVSDGYTALENRELAEMADAFAGADRAVTVETAGSLYNEKRVYALVKLPGEIRAASEDLSVPYLLLSNGHGGSAAFSILPTAVRVVCANTMSYAMHKDGIRGMSFRHTGDFAAKLDAARTVLGAAKDETEKFQEKVTALVGCDLSVGQAEEFIKKAWDASFGKPLKSLGEEALLRYTARRERDVQQILGMLDNERNSLQGIRGTAWAAFNAVTEFHDHVRGWFKDTDKSEGRLASNLFGTSATAKRKALKLALAMV
jgi:phage/plasmid-like protein (TIGR03299 family)